MPKEDTLAREKSGETERRDRVLAVFEDHYRLALKTMSPEGALATAYSAAQNYLQSLAPPRPPIHPESVR